MRPSFVAFTAVLLQSAAALQLTRRQIAGAAAFGIVQPARADVPIDPFNSMCLGFGCNSPQGVDSPGAPAPTSARIIIAARARHRRDSLVLRTGAHRRGLDPLEASPGAHRREESKKRRIRRRRDGQVLGRDERRALPRGRRLSDRGRPLVVVSIICDADLGQQPDPADVRRGAQAEV